MTDKELIAAILDGNTQAFSHMVKRFERLVSHIVYRLIDNEMDREEIAQDIFVKVHKNLGAFNFQSKLSTWVATIAYREAVNHLKKNKKWKEMKDLEQVEFQLEASTLSYETEDMNRFIHRAVNQLPETYRAILTLYHLDGFSYQEIVAVMDMPEGTVKNYLFRARKKLRDLLAKHYDQEAFIS